jgi:chromosome segregation ATPase
MSTAGKVLTVLSALLLVVWTIMISAVAQINENGAKAVAARKKAVEDIETGIAKTEGNAADLRVKTNAEQIQKENELREVRLKQAMVERQLETARESLTRVQFQLENYTKAAASSKADLEARQQEKTDLEKTLADNEALVKKLQGENDDLLGQLEKLRNDFQANLRKNTEAVQKELKGGGKASKTAE